MTDTQVDLVLELTRAVVLYGGLPPPVAALLDGLAEVVSKKNILQKQRCQDQGVPARPRRKQPRAVRSSRVPEQHAVE